GECPPAEQLPDPICGRDHSPGQLTPASCSCVATAVKPEPRPTVGIIGMGRLGSSLAAALERAGYAVTTTANAPSVEVARSSQLMFLTVPDRAIAQVAQGLTLERDQSVVHCSGA